jgi:DNA-binding MarR family transcriptional regulator
MVLMRRAMNVTNDPERRLTIGDHNALRVWLRLMSVHKLIILAVRRRLQERFSITLARFDLMAQLERERAGLRMVDLSDRLMVTSGNITQITDQLQSEGLVERHPDPRSRRAWLVKLTRAGRKAFGPIARAHESWLVELLSGLSPKEKSSLLALLAKEKDYLATRARAARRVPERKNGMRAKAPRKGNRKGKR